jgi:predicted ArsR family transcriptional regulator
MENGDQEVDVLAFVFENINTVPHLEALLLIWQNASESWTATRLAARIYVGTPQAAGILEDLYKRGYVSKEAGPAYRFAHEWDVERQIMPRLASTYSRNLIGMTRMIHSKGSASVQEFARAFQIKKEP